MTKSTNTFARFNFTSSSNTFARTNFSSSTSSMSRYRFATSTNGYSGDNLQGDNFAFFNEFEGDYFGGGSYGGVRHFNK